MNQTAIIVSKCIEIAYHPQRWYTFQFNGTVNATNVRKVELKGKEGMTIEVGSEYLVYVQIEEIDRGVMAGTILKYKPLSACWDN